MNNDPAVLLIEDDNSIQNLIMISLKAYGYQGIVTKKGQDGLDVFLSGGIDLLLLDLGLPDLDGLEVLEQIREKSKVPVIVISARSQEKEKIQAFEMGADDYVTKPFQVGELMARIKVALRHAAVEQERQQFFQIGRLEIDDEKRKVSIEGEEIHFTPIEYRLLLLMVKHRGKVLTHHFIQLEIWENETLDDYQTLRVFMAGIRRKIEQDSSKPKFLVTEIGVGYRFADE